MQKFGVFLKNDREYFSLYRDTITLQNNHMLTNGCLIYAAVLALYTFYTEITNQPVLLRNMYLVFDAIHLALCVFVFARTARVKSVFISTQCYCLMLELSLLAFFALEGALVSRTQHSLYVPIAILLVQLLFIHSALCSGVMILTYTVSFAVLSHFYKTPEASANDMSIAVATFLSANIGYVLIANIRHSESSALRNFESLSKMDMLTGLYNKSTIEELCSKKILESDQQFTFYMIDIDNFKRVNDTFGHEAGDEVLKQTGAILRSVFHDGDLIGRFGGDEFVVMMVSCGDRAIARERAECLISKLSEQKFSSPGLTVQCSVGIAFGQTGDNLLSVKTRADEALYSAKSEGRGRCHTEEISIPAELCRL